MKLLGDLTQRRYSISATEGGVMTHVSLSLDYLFRDRVNDSELVYAIHEIADKLLDLKTGESMYFNPNRDNSTEIGIILRDI